MRNIFTLVFFWVLATQSHAQTWTGAVNERWDVAGNWNTNAVPATNGTVIIPGTLQAGRPWPRMFADVSIGNFTMQSGSQLNTGGFNILLNNTSGATISITGSTITNPVPANTTTITTGEGLLGTQNINGSTFNGHFHFVVRSTNGNAAFYEASSAPNTWNGNLTVTARNSNGIILSNEHQSTFNGNVSVTKLDQASFNSFNIFTNGNATVAGDLTIINPAGNASALTIGNNNNWTQVNGKLNIDIRRNGQGTYTIRRLKNNTTGGNVYISRGSSLSSIAFCDWQVTKLTLDSLIGQFSLNDINITGETELSSVVSPVIYMSRNIFNGPFSISLQAGTFYEAFADANAGIIYKGNAVFNNLGTANIIIGYSDSSSFERDFTLNSPVPESIRRIRFAGNENSVITKQGNGGLTIERGEIAKTGNGRLILGSPVSFSINNSFVLTSGQIQSSDEAPLRLNNLVSLSGGSLASHVIGPIDKVGVAASSLPFTYPIGSGFTYNPVTQNSHGGSSPDTFRAQYILQNPGSNGLDPDSKANTLSNVSRAGYWQFNRISGNRNVNLTFSFGSNPYHEFPPLNNLKIAQWNGAQWADLGNGGTTGNTSGGTITHTGNLSTYSFFALANQLEEKYWYAISHPGTGPDGTPVKVTGVQGFPGYQSKQLPAGSYSADSIYLLPNGGSSGFKLRDRAGVEKDDTTYTLSAPPPTNFVMANATGNMNFEGWRHFVYVRNPSNQIIGAIADNNLALGTATMQAFFASGATAQAPNGGRAFLKRSFRVTSTLSPSGTRRVRLFISKAELTDLVAADPAGLPNGINSLHMYRYTGAQEEPVFNPRPGGTTEIIPPSAIVKTDLGTMWGLDAEVSGFSGFYLAGLPNVVAICPGSSLQLKANSPGTTYRWQVSTGGNFSNLNNNATYSGVTTSTLTINNAASSLYGSIYRCVINGNNAQPTTQVIFSTTWLGTANGQWNNPANWPCGVIPDANTDVVVKPGAPNQPNVNANTTVRTLTAEPGANVNVANGVVLSIAK
jgi:hypothetical protein